LSFSIVHRITSLTIGTFLSSCRQIARATVVDVEAVEAARASQVMVTVVMAVAVVVAVAVTVAVPTGLLLSTEPQHPEEYAIFIGLLEHVIAASTARTNMRQGS
jgi:hypothetical protein